MQEDGNFVLQAGIVRLWASNTTGVGHRLVLRNDGVLAIYDRNETVKWKLSNQERGKFLVCQDDGNLVLRFEWNGDVLWSTNTSQSKS